MGSSGFEGWTEERVSQHNARVAAGGRCSGMTAANNAATVKHLVEKPEAKVSTFTRNPESTAEPFVSTIEKHESTDVQNLNKTERSFYDILMLDQRHILIWVQAFTLKMADDTRYTPDFVTLTDGKLMAWEVKGFFRDDAKVKIKVAARMFPVFTFTLVRKDKSGWTYETVKP